MKPVRGTYDLYDKEMDIHNYVIGELKNIVSRYNFNQIKTPIFEHTELFRRSTGETSDIVQKEMYDFLDKGKRSLTLRPELTASVVRAFISNKIYGQRKKQYKFFYYGEVFRYERPQSGRYRQFYQFGVEMFEEKSIYSDVEIISLCSNIIKHFELDNKVTLKINTIGSSKERAIYKDLLREYFKGYENDLCSDCLSRLETNPLRILDCKKDKDKDFLKKAPSLINSLQEETVLKYESIIKLLNELNINYTKDETLVRGLDYYNDIVFEFVYKSDKIEHTLIGGGRYDGLINEFSSQNTPAIGFGLGIERMIEAIKENTPSFFDGTNQSVDIYYMSQDESSYKYALKSMDKLRMNGIKCNAIYSQSSLKSLYKEAEKEDAVFVVILTNELNQTEEIKVKNMITKEEKILKLLDFEESILQEFH